MGNEVGTVVWTWRFRKKWIGRSMERKIANEAIAKPPNFQEIIVIKDLLSNKDQNPFSETFYLPGSFSILPASFVSDSGEESKYQDLIKIK